MTNLDWFWLIIPTSVWAFVVYQVWYAQVPDPGGDYALLSLLPIELWLALAVITWRLWHTSPGGVICRGRCSKWCENPAEP